MFTYVCLERNPEKLNKWSLKALLTSWPSPLTLECYSGVGGNIGDLELAQRLQTEEDERQRSEEEKREREEFKKLQVRYCFWMVNLQTVVPLEAEYLGIVMSWSSLTRSDLCKSPSLCWGNGAEVGWKQMQSLGSADPGRGTRHDSLEQLGFSALSGAGSGWGWLLPVLAVLLSQHTCCLCSTQL